MRETITPERAAALLAKNECNRPLSKKLAQKYADDMRQGLWDYNGSTILVADDGTLLDGQHRLQAAIYADMPFDTEVIEGLPVSVRPTIDAGRRRSAGDVLSMMSGASRSNTGIAASARLVLNYCCGLAPSQSQSTPAIVRLLQRHPDIADAYRLASKCNGILTPGPLGAVLFIGQRAPGMERRALRFVEAIQSGTDMQQGDPRLAVREAFINKRMSGAGVRLPDATWCFIATARAWNAWATGQALAKISLKKNADGTWTVPDIIGGPPRGEGVDALDGVKLSPTAKRARAELEEDVGVTAP